MALNIVPMAKGTGAPAGSEAPIGRSASQDRIERAKLVAGGQTPETAQAQPQEKDQLNVRRIKMKTQRSVYRDLPPTETLSPDTQSNIPDTSVQAQANPEDTRPLSPQFAALAKQKRALQEKERAIQAKEQELAKRESAPAPQDHIPISALKSNPLGILLEHGVTYDQLIEAVETGQQTPNPAVTKLEAEIQALKQGIDNHNKTLADREVAQEQQALDQMEREAQGLIAQGDQFEMVREKNAVKDVRKLIEKTYKTTGEILEVSEALQLVEDALLDDAIALARIQKVQSRLIPAPTQQTQQLSQPGVRVMRTLTSRDGVSAPTSARERAIAAFHGRKTQG